MNVSTTSKLNSALSEFIKKYLSFILSGIVILGLVLLYFISPGYQEFIDETWDILMSEDHERIQAYFEDFGAWGPIAIILFIILQMFLIIFPSWLPIIVAVLAYGLWAGVIINLVGIGLASTLGYFIGDKLENTVFRNFMSKKKSDKMKYWISNYGFGTVVLFRISPFFSNDGISFIAGIFEMDYKRFISATYTGMIPLSFAVGYFSQDIEKLEEGLYWIGGVGFVLYAFYVYLDHKKRKKKQKKQIT